jgi:hypothetical protein
MENHGKNKSVFLRHLSRWKDCYQTFGVIVALGISTFALWQASVTLRIQTEEFHLRNRPIVDITEARFGGQSIDFESNKTYPHSIEMRIECVSDVPATNFKATCKTFVDQKNEGVATKISLGALSKGKSWMAGAYLQDDIYQLAKDPNHKFTVNVNATYSGMLGEADDAYGISFLLVYNPVREEFGFQKRNYK